MRLSPWLPVPAVLVALLSAAPAHAGFPRDRTPSVAVEGAGAPWSHSFSLVAGGGTQKARDGMVAGRADLGRIWASARDGAGRFLVSSTSGLWAVGSDGRLARIHGIPSERGHREQLAALGDGSVVVAVGHGVAAGVYTVAPGAGRGTLLATSAEPGPLGVGAAADGSLIAIAGGRVLKRSGSELVASGPRLWEDDGIREPRGAGTLPSGGLLVASLFPNGGAGGDPEQDDSSLIALASSRPRTVFAPPAPSSIRKLAVLPSGRALIDANASTEGDLDVRPLALAAGPKVDRQRFGYGVGEEFFGWIARRRVLVRQADGHMNRTRWAGPPADDIAHDGNDDNILVASSGRLWSTRPGLGAPGLAGLWRGGRVTVRLASAAPVTVTARDISGHVLARTARKLEAGRSVVALHGLPRRGLLRITIDARDRTSAAWAFAGARRLPPAEADRVLSAVARRLYVGFEGAAAHGVDRCVSVSSVTVRCRWSTGGSDVPTTERSVTVRLRPAGYLLRPGRARPAALSGRNRHLLGAPFDASA